MGITISRLNSNSWSILDEGVRFFLLTGSEKALLIDSGMVVYNARDIVTGLTDLPVSLLNTHADRDHIGSNEQFGSFYMHPDEEPLYRQSGLPGTVIPVREGDILDLGNRRLEIIHLPGHTPGSIAVLDIGGRVLISGDPIQQNGHIFMFGDHRNMQDYIRSLDHLETYAGRFDEIWPSHGALPLTPDILPKLKAGAESVLRGEVPGKPVEMFGKTAMAYNLGFCTLLCNP